VGVAYGTDPARVIDILVGIARNHPQVLVKPAPLAVFDRFGESALHFTLFCWAFVDTFFITRSELTIAINNASRKQALKSHSHSKTCMFTGLTVGGHFWISFTK